MIDENTRVALFVDAVKSDCALEHALKLAESFVREFFASGLERVHFVRSGRVVNITRVGPMR